MGSLAIAPGSTLDITNNVLNVSYGNGFDPIATIQSYLADGFASGWTSGEIVSSTVAALNASQSALVYTVGCYDGADRIVSGLPVGEIEVLPCLAGDAKMLGNVNFGDFQVLSQYFGQSGTNWDEGNFSYGSSTDFGDFQLLSQNFGQTASALTSGELASINSFAAQFGEGTEPNADGVGFSLVSVPEPAATGLVIFGVTGLVVRRRRRDCHTE
jgi:hypothetical protein